MNSYDSADCLFPPPRNPVVLFLTIQFDITTLPLFIPSHTCINTPPPLINSVDTNV